MQECIPAPVLANLVEKAALNLFLDSWPTDLPFTDIVEDVRVHARSSMLGELTIAAPIVAKFITKAQQEMTDLLATVHVVRQQFEPDITYTLHMRSLTTGGPGTTTFIVLPDETIALAAMRVAKSYGAYVVRVVAEFPFGRPG